MKVLSRSLIIALGILFLVSIANILSAQDITFKETDNNLGITSQSGQFGCAWGDYDEDGDLDLLISGQGNPHLLYKYEGGQFVDVSEEAGLATTPPVAVYAQGVVWGDFDNDGDLDFFTGQSGVHLYLNNNGVFGDSSEAANLSTIESGNTLWGVTAADYDNDGDLDVALAGGNQEGSGLAGPARVLQNNNGVFTEVTDALIGFDLILESWNPQWVDVNNDGVSDLWLPTIRTPNEGCALFLNGDNEFIYTDPNETGLAAKSAISSSWADYDNDGDLDLFLTPFSGDNDGNCKLYRNDGGTFTNIAPGTNLDSAYTNSRGSCWGDYDNDGDQDLLVGRNGSVQKLFRNDGDSFVEVGEETGAGVPPGGEGAYPGYRCATFVDYDNDGFLDIYLMERPKKLLHNEGNSNHWIVIKPKGITNNTAGIGARVRIVTGSLSQIRYVQAGAGGITNGFLWPHFGLGSATSVDSVIVQWPNGVVDVSTNVPADRYYTFVEGTGITGVAEERNTFPMEYALRQNYPNPFNPSTTIEFSLPVRSEVHLVLINILGQVVKEIATGYFEPGNHKVRLNASNLATGIYFYKLEAGGFVSVKKLVLIK